MTKGKRTSLILGLFLIGVVLIFVIITLKGRSSIPKYRTAKIQRGDISIIVTATGTVNPVTTVQVGSQVSGTIYKLYADFNDRVKKGQLVAQLDPTFLKAQVAQAMADLEKANASVNQSKRDLDRADTLFAKELISEVDRDQAQTNYELALAGQKSAQAAEDRAETNLKYATIVSPIDGVVISRDVDVGQTVAASLQAPTLFTIANDLTRMQVEASVDEADIGQIREGEKATFTVDAYPDLQFEGTVNQIRLLPTIVQNVVTYTVILDVSNPKLLLKPGMTANLTILVDESKDVLKVPSGALRFQPTLDKRLASRNPSLSAHPLGGSNRYPSDSAHRSPSGSHSQWNSRPKVWILSANGNPKPVMVQTGISDGSFTAVTSDSLKEGEEVIVGENGQTNANGAFGQVNPFMPRHR
jgi:HlyD family secretion protein